MPYPWIKNPSHNGILLMILSSVFGSLVWAQVKFVTHHLPIMEAIFFRAAISLAILTLLMIFQKIPFIGRNNTILLLRGLTGFIALVLTFYVTSRIPIADASMLNYTSVLFVALFSVLFFKESVTTKLAAYILLALFGTVAVIKPQWHVLNIPGLLGLLSGLLAAISQISIKQLHKTDSFFTMVFQFSLVSTLGSLLFWRQFRPPTVGQWVALLGLGLCGTVAQLLMTYSYKYTDASIVSPYAFLTVLLAALWGALFWHELPDRWSVIGGLMIIGSGIGILKIKAARDKIPANDGIRD